MAVSVQTFANGDVDYIAKHNANYQNIKVAVEALQSAIAAQAGGGGGGGTTAVSYEALFGISDAVLGEGSYAPTQASSDNLDIDTGYAYVSGSDAVVSQGSVVTLDFQGQTTDTYYIHVDNAGVPSFDTSSANSLYSVDYDSGTGNFSNITRTGNLAWTYTDWENTQTNIWGIVYDGLDTRLSSIEGASYGVLQKTAEATNITLTDKEALEQALIEISDGPQTVDIDLIVPAQARIYQIVNNASTTYGVTLKVSGQAGYQVMGNHFAILYCDGVNTVTLFDLDLSSGGEPPNKFKVLKDTPTSYTGEGGKFVRVNATPDGLEFHALVWGDLGGTLSNQSDLQTALDGKSDTHTHPYIGAITAEPFTDLNDTPANYTGAAKHAVKVTAAGTGTEFVDDPYFVSSFFPGAGTASKTLMVHVFAVAVDFPSGLTNSRGTSEAASTAQTDYDIQKNGVSVGTMRFSAVTSVATFIMASATSFAAGDKLQLVAPGTLDSTLVDIAMTLEGTR